MKAKEVLEDWMKELTWKQQSSLISSSRGPDTHYCPNIKRISKFIRKTTQKDGDAYGNYMKIDEPPILNSLKKEFEFCTIHYANHLLTGLEIIAYKHFNSRTASTAREYYVYLAGRLHLNPETKKQMEKRLQDRL
jgi:hypothetical protein